jgi:hypothetical protein
MKARVETLALAIAYGCSILPDLMQLTGANESFWHLARLTLVKELLVRREVFEELARGEFAEVTQVN